MVSFQISVNYITLCTCMYVYCIVSTCITCSSGLHTIQEGEIISLEHSLGFCTVPCGLSSTPPAGTAGGDGAGLHTPTAPGPGPDPDPDQGPNQGDSELCMHVHVYTMYTVHIYTHCSLLRMYRLRFLAPHAQGLPTITFYVYLVPWHVVSTHIYTCTYIPYSRSRSPHRKRQSYSSRSRSHSKSRSV